MREEFGAKDPKSLMLRFHTQTAGVQLTAQQPEVNLVRVAVQGLAAVLGGTQSLHTNSYDEAIALPTVKAATLALRTQQVLAYETDVTATVDPFAGSYVVEAMTDEVEKGALELMAQVEEMGGAVAAIEKGFQKSEIERSAYDVALGIDSGERVVVGLNRYRSETRGAATSRCASTRRSRPTSASGCGVLREKRDNAAVDKALAELKEAAAGDGNVLLPDADGAEGARHRRRGLQRAARGLGRLHAAGVLLDGPPAELDRAAQPASSDVAGRLQQEARLALRSSSAVQVPQVAPGQARRARARSRAGLLIAPPSSIRPPGPPWHGVAPVPRSWCRRYLLLGRGRAHAVGLVLVAPDVQPCVQASAVAAACDVQHA